MTLDLVDPILDGLRLAGSIFLQMELQGAWGFTKPKLEGSSFYIVTAGRCDIRLESGASVTAMEGDLVILPTGDAHVFTSGPTAKLVPFTQVVAGLGWDVGTPGMRYKAGLLQYECGDGGRTSIVAGLFDFEDFGRNPLLLRLPGVLHLPHDGSGAESGDGFASVLRLLVSEVQDHRSGSGSVAGRLADVLFVQAVRSYLRTRPTAEVNWCRGMHDPRIGKALALIHDEPGRPWKVEALAELAGMSRARFASRFHELVGESPISYLTDWRMHCASRQLTARRKTLAAISLDHGYTSEIAFSKAFKRWSGLLPRDYRRATPAWPKWDGQHADSSA